MTGFLGIDYDDRSTAAIIDELAARDPDAPFAYLVTPNVDHVVRLHEDQGADREAVHAAYRTADWCTCDSRILAALARTSGVDLSVVPGSDLTAAIIGSVLQPGDTIALVGGSDQTTAILAAMLPGVTIVEHRPPMGLRHNRVAIEDTAAFIAGTGARFVFLAVGSPQQELVAAATRARGDATGIGLCIGAGIEFVTGERRRAPQFIQRLHLEWAHRLLGDPRRLWRRYLVTGPRVFGLALADARRRRRGPSA
jgi:exopolysaccharide biosynthesis WecB/TagA/CpsF family protein